MSFHISTWSIKNPVPTIVIFLILGIWGLISFFQLEIDKYPNIDIPSVSITITQRGAGTTELESQVTKKVEDAVAGLNNIEQIVSVVSEEASTTTIGFKLGTNTSEAIADVRNEIAQIRQDLPQDIEEPIIRQQELFNEPVATYAVVSSKLSVEELSDLVDRQINRSLSKVPGVAKIERLGGLDREIRVDLDSNRLQAVGITAAQVNEQIRNFNVDLPGGRSELGGGEQNVRTLGSADTVSELENYRLTLLNGDSITLSSLGQVRDSYADTRTSAYLNGQEVVAFAVHRTNGSSVVTVAEQVKRAIALLKPNLPDDVKLELIFSRAKPIFENYTSTVNSIYLGCILTAVIVAIFLSDWRATIIIVAAIPLSIIPTFAIMSWLGYNLNTITLLAIGLAVGNLVDDAICVTENIDQHLKLGKKPRQAALDGTKEIGLAILATTATVVAVFIPVAFMGGIPGQFFQPFGLTVAIATGFSTLVACTFTPMVSAYWLKPKKTEQITPWQNQVSDQLLLGSGFLPGQSFLQSHESEQSFSLLEPNRKLLAPTRKANPPKDSPQPPQRYRRLLGWALDNRTQVLLMGGAFFLFSLQLFAYVPHGLIDSGDTGLSTVYIELPPGAKLQETEAIAGKISSLIQSNQVVEDVLTTTGSDNQVNHATIYVKLKPLEERSLTQAEFEKQTRQSFASLPGAKISFDNRGVALGSKDIWLTLKSDEIDTLEQTATRLESRMQLLPNLVEVSSSKNLIKPEIIIEPDTDRAADLGVSVSAIANTAALALVGDLESNLAQFDLSDRQIPIRVQLDPDERKDIDTIKNLNVPSSYGTLVPLSAVADIRIASGPVKIERLDRTRQISLKANLEDIALGTGIAQVRKLIAVSSLPPSVKQAPAPKGEIQVMQDIFRRFIGAIAFGIVAIYAILILLYNNFIYPFAILAALPISLGGALLSLLLTDKELGLFALIGIILLTGLVTKNAILLVDFALAEIKKQKSVEEAVTLASTSRLRAIVMTSVSTVAGMVPIALGFGTDGDVRSPMAIAVIGGFSISTLLTLVIVPVMFTYIHRIVVQLRRRRRLLKM